jgi:hypothetical protein
MVERHKQLGVTSRVLTFEEASFGEDFFGQEAIWPLVQKYIDEQEGEPIVDDSRFEIESS